jgi:hypothetical protein
MVVFGVGGTSPHQPEDDAWNIQNTQKQCLESAESQGKEAFCERQYPEPEDTTYEKAKDTKS